MIITPLVINLDRVPERLLLFSEHARSIGLPFERIAGVDGRALSADELKSHIAFADEDVIGPAEIGCWLSHRSAWKLIAQRSHSWGVVLEDDVCISPELPLLLRDLSWIPKDAHIVKIEAWPLGEAKLSNRKSIVGDRELRKLNGLLVCTGAYLISRQACVALLAMGLDCRFPVDRYLFDPRSPMFGHLVTYVMLPALCIQRRFLADEHRREGDSLISLDRQPSNGGLRRAARAPRRSRPFGGKIRRERKRIMQQLKELWSVSRFVEWR